MVYPTALHRELSQHDIWQGYTNYPYPRAADSSTRDNDVVVAETPSNTLLRVQYVGDNAPLRSEVESYIYEAYRQVHQANIASFLPHIFAAYNGNKEIKGAIGYQKAGSAPLFFETYLNTPIEVELSARLDRIISRRQIAEVGNLASSAPEACRKLLLLLCVYFYQNDIQWAVFTGTRAVRIACKRLKFETLSIQSADKNKLGQAQHDWGTYYENSPVVIACDIKKSIANMYNNLPINMS